MNPFPMKPVSGFVSKWVRAFDMCLHSWMRRDVRVGVKELLRGNRVPFTWDSSRSGMKGFMEKRARRPTGLHHGRTIPKKNIAFHDQHHVRWK